MLEQILKLDFINMNEVITFNLSLTRYRSVIFAIK